ncbi:MAG TPA: SDR family oxidoreductase [Bacteroidota bacterium]|nr:SDR family oxidoreductase [Bacteroidota bacterium]
MNLQDITQQYDFTGKTVAVTGGTGVLCAEMARALVGCNANVAILIRDTEKAKALVDTFEAGAGAYEIYKVDVLDKPSVERAAAAIVEKFGRIDCLINGAGGNNPKATTTATQSFFDLPSEAMDSVTSLNFDGTIIPCQVFGKYMAEQKDGVILNVSSMSAFRPLTRVVAYSAAKAAISNFTQWLASHMALEYSPSIRVNALAPGFFLTNQNRLLLTDKDTGALTERGKKILDHTPMGRFGKPEDLIGAMLWLLSPASKFVTGIVLPVDGGFSAFTGI